jgi:hypothetical protein
MSDTASDRPQFTLRQLLAIVAVIAVALAVATPWLRWVVAGDTGRLFLNVVAAVAVFVGLNSALGVLALRAQSTGAAVISEAVSRSVGAITVIVVLCGMVPAVESIFKQYEVDLPSSTQCLILLSNAVARYWYLFLPAVIWCVVVDVAMFSRLYAKPRGQPWALAWSAIITTLLVGAMIYSLLALLGPLFEVS